MAQTVPSVPPVPLKNTELLERCILQLNEIGAVKFGDFLLKSGIRSPVYFDLRVIVSYPKIMEMVAFLVWESVKTEKFNHICGVPYTALPIATIISVTQQMPMLIRRKEAKAYGTKKLVEGVFAEGQTCLIVEDVIVSGSSVIETVNVLRAEKLEVQRAVVFLDREQGGAKNLEEVNISFTSVITITNMMAILYKHKKVSDELMRKVMVYLGKHTHTPLLNPDSSAESAKVPKKHSLEERASKANNPLISRLFRLIEEKSSNLCVAVDVETSKELLSLTDKLGPYICVLKTHIDIIKDFTQETVQSLKNLSIKHNFLIFEDRKFADIGNTVRLQYSCGVYKILDWAHLVTIHGLPGPSGIQGLMSATSDKDRGCVIVAEMSSDKNLITPSYVKGCVIVAQSQLTFVVGLVCQSPLESEYDFISFVPGVSLASSQDSMGQRYVTPEVAVMEKGADVVIVGRGITQSEDPVATAKEYRDRSYAALSQRANLRNQ